MEAPCNCGGNYTLQKDYREEIREVIVTCNKCGDRMTFSGNRKGTLKYEMEYPDG